MNRPTDPTAALEAELAALAPATPSADLRRRVAEAIEAAPVERPAPAAARDVRPAGRRWLAERLLWACGGAAAGALAASLVFALRPAAPGGAAAPAVAVATAAGPPTALAEGGPPVEVAEEAVAWSDGGVQFLDDRTPARILRRVAVERHRPTGGAEYRIPRQDVYLLPVALR